MLTCQKPNNVNISISLSSLQRRLTLIMVARGNGQNAHVCTVLKEIFNYLQVTSLCSSVDRGTLTPVREANWKRTIHHLPHFPKTIAPFPYCHELQLHKSELSLGDPRTRNKRHHAVQGIQPFRVVAVGTRARGNDNRRQILLRILRKP